MHLLSGRAGMRSRTHTDGGCFRGKGRTDMGSLGAPGTQAKKQGPQKWGGGLKNGSLPLGASETLIKTMGCLP